jgi:hypothetical protein
MFAVMAPVAQDHRLPRPTAYDEPKLSRLHFQLATPDILHSLPRLHSHWYLRTLPNGMRTSVSAKQQEAALLIAQCALRLQVSACSCLHHSLRRCSLGVLGDDCCLLLTESLLAYVLTMGLTVA